MVARHQEIKDAKVTVVDLDGTLITGNSLHEYILAGLHVLWCRRKPWRLTKVLSLLGLRKLHLISHRQMKFGAAAIIGADPDVLRSLAERTSKMHSTEVASLIRKYESEGCKVLIASAAFDFYIPYITEYPYIATRFHDNPDKAECRGENKAKAVEQWLRHNNCTLEAVITDHTDDLPLLALECRHKHMIKKNA